MTTTKTPSSAWEQIFPGRTFCFFQITIGRIPTLDLSDMTRCSFKNQSISDSSVGAGRKSGPMLVERSHQKPEEGFPPRFLEAVGGNPKNRCVATAPVDADPVFRRR